MIEKIIAYLLILFQLAPTFKTSVLLSDVNDRIDLSVFFFVATFTLSFLHCLYKKIPFFKVKYFYLYLIFTLFVLGNCFVNFLSTETADLKLLKFLTFNFGIVFICLCVGLSESIVITYVKGLKYTSIICSVESLWRIYFLGNTRFMGTFGTDSYQYLSLLAAIGCITCLNTVITSRKVKLTNKILNIVGACICFLAMLTSGGRGGFAGFLIASIFIVLTQNKFKTMNLKSFLNYSMGSLLLILLYLILSDLFGNYNFEWGSRRLYGSLSGIEKTLIDSERFALWDEGINCWLNSPFLGNGFGSFNAISNFPQSRHPHNIFIETLSDLGILGFFIITILLLKIFGNYFKLNYNSKKTHATLLTSIYLIHLTVAQVSGDYTDNRNLFGSLIMLAGYLQLHVNDENISDQKIHSAHL